MYLLSCFYCLLRQSATCPDVQNKWGPVKTKSWGEHFPHLSLCFYFNGKG